MTVAYIDILMHKYIKHLLPKTVHVYENKHTSSRSRYLNLCRKVVELGKKAPYSALDPSKNFRRPHTMLKLSLLALSFSSAEVSPDVSTPASAAAALPLTRSWLASPQSLCYTPG